MAYRPKAYKNQAKLRQKNDVKVWKIAIKIQEILMR